MTALFLALLVLLLVSGTFSGAEAALFTVATWPPGSRPPLARRLLGAADAALASILLANLAVNLAFFALAAAAARRFPGVPEWLGAAAAVGVLVVAGEILPKVLAHRAPGVACRLLLPPVAVVHGLLAPLLGRLARPGEAPRPLALDVEDAHSLLQAEGGALLPPGERRLLEHVLEFGRLRAGSVRLPLAEVPRIPMETPLAAALEELRRAGRPWGAVVDAAGEVRGALDLRRELRGRTAGEAMVAVPVLPEQAPLARAAVALQETSAPFLLLVDEYGTSAGILERGRMADTLLDRLPGSPPGQLPPVVPLGGGRFQVDASLPLHEFRDRFGDPGPVDPRVDTVGGLVQERLGRLPRPGDRIHVGPFYGGVDLLVGRTDGPRILELEVRPRPGNRGVPATHPEAGIE